jgi:hypothetical protein
VQEQPAPPLNSNHPPPPVHPRAHTYSDMSQADANTTPQALREMPKPSPCGNVQSFLSEAAALATAASPAMPALGQQVCVLHTHERKSARERDGENASESESERESERGEWGQRGN